MAFDNSAPAKEHIALNDIEKIRGNDNALRSFEASASTSPPTNPVGGQFWWTTDTTSLYQRNQSNSTWTFRWSEADPPVKTSDLTTHTNSNITNATTVHGIRQGSGNNLDADKLDGYHASDFLASSHGTATSNIHGVGAGAIVGTTLTQTLTNKTLTSSVLDGGSITNNITASSGKTVDGRDLSEDGAKLDTYPGSGLATPSDGTVTQAKMASASVGQAQLKTATGEVSVPSGGTMSLTLPGGEYGFFPQIKMSSTATQRWLATLRSNKTASDTGHNSAGFTAYATVIVLGSESSDGIYAQQRYIQSSPPYKIGDKVWGHFLFLLRDIATGTVRSAYEAEDPPWAYNGKAWLLKDDPDRLSEVPHSFADYWAKDPAMDGLEIVMVDLSERNVKKAKTDLWKEGKSLLEAIPAVVAGKGRSRQHSDYLIPNIPRFTDRVKIVVP